MKRLYDITDKSSGIVIYPESSLLISCYWGNQEGLPVITPLGSKLVLPTDFEVVDKKEIEDCQSELPEIEHAYISECYFNDLKGQPGHKYVLEREGATVIVICPESWR